MKKKNYKKKKETELEEREKQIALTEESLKEQQAVIDRETKKLSVRDSDEVGRISELALLWSFKNPDNGNHLG